MDWADAIGKNRDDLIEIVTRLFVLAGIRTGAVVASLPRSLRIRILSILRPAEFAARRLIAMAACKLVTSGAHQQGQSPKLKDGTKNSTGAAGNRPAPESPEPPLPAFPLFDPFKPFGHPWLEDGENGQPGVWHDRETQRAPDDPVDAQALCRRIRALERALQDLEGQAARLARWRARRHRERCKPKRFSPLRPGRPPGWRKRPKSRVESVLKECHFLARDAWNTS